jgi:hypothetical protein
VKLEQPWIATELASMPSLPLNVTTATKKNKTKNTLRGSISDLNVETHMRIQSLNKKKMNQVKIIHLKISTARDKRDRVGFFEV